VSRQHIEVPAPAHGWLPPWPNVAEVASVLTHDLWTLVGGLMTQVHAVSAGVPPPRVTSDVDMVLHIETAPWVANVVARSLEGLGYEFAASIDPREESGHRFTRPGRDGVSVDVVDVMAADHVAPRARQRLRGKDMVAIEGGTQALLRTMTASLDIEPGKATTISVPSVFGALVLKAAAHIADTRDRQRHLVDAVVLLAALEDPFDARAGFAGSDGRRLRALSDALDRAPSSWDVLPEPYRTHAQLALRILLTSP